MVDRTLARHDLVLLECDGDAFGWLLYTKPNPAAKLSRVPAKDRTRRRVVPSQDRARASSEAILGAAELLLSERGFLRTTTNAIATRAGVNVALVYRYFAGKEAIVGALIDRAAQATYESVQQAIAASTNLPLAVATRALLEALVHPPLEPALHRELVEHVEVTKRRQLVAEVRTKLAGLFDVFLARRSTELRQLSDPEATLFVLQHALEAATHAAAFYRPDGLSQQRVLDALNELVVRALAPVHDASSRDRPR